MISFELSSELTMFRTTARDFARASLRPVARAAERALRLPDGLGAEYVSLGFAGIEVLEVHGGLGLGLAERTIVEEELAYGDLGLALAMPAPGAFAEAVRALGTDRDGAAVERLLARGERGGVAWCEEKPRPGSFSTEAREAADGTWRITGRKTEVIAGDRLGALVVFARARPAAGGDEFLGAFVMETDGGAGNGVRASEPTEGLGLNAAPVVTLSLEDAPATRLTGADDRFEEAVAEMFARIALVGAARSTGVARAAFERARDYAESREAFGKPIAHFQGLAFLLADMVTRVEVMRGLVQRAAWAFDHGEADAAKRGLMAAAEGHEGAMFVTNAAVQVLGGAGFVQDEPVEKWMRDAKAHMSYGLPHQLADLAVGRLALGGGALTMQHDAPMPELQPVLV